MKKFVYKMKFSPYQCSIKASNYKEAWKVLKKAWPEYDVKEVVAYLSLEITLDRSFKV